MTRLFAFFFIFGTAFGLSADHIFKQYAYTKILSSCFGEDAVARLTKNVKSACDKCSALKATDSAAYDIDGLINDINKYETPQFVPQRPGFQYVPFFISSPLVFRQDIPEHKVPGATNQFQPFSPAQQSHAFPQPSGFKGFQQQASAGQLTRIGPINPVHQNTGFLQFGNAPLGSFENPFFDNRLNRKKRALLSTPDSIAQLKEDLVDRISNMTCALRQLNYLDKNNMPNYSTIAGEIQNLVLDQDLKNDLHLALDFCRDFSRCIPVQKLQHPMAKELGPAAAFMKCMSLKQVTGCMKKELRDASKMKGYSQISRSPLLRPASVNPNDVMDDTMGFLFGEPSILELDFY